jgi:FkbM family methyltransferase
MSVLFRLRDFAKTALQNMAPRLAVKRAVNNRAIAEPELDLLPELVTSTRLAVDVGGNLGVYTHRLVSMVERVIVFEANPRLAQVLARTFPQADVRHQAVTDHHGELTLIVPLENGFAVDGLGSVEHGSEVAGQSYSVTTAMLDDLHNLDIGFVKIDVEGHEMSVLHGGRALIAEQRPILLVESEERHRSGTIAELFAFFAAENYRGIFVYGKDVLPIEQFAPHMQDVKVAEDYQRPDGVFANNFIFIPAEQCTAEKIGQIAQLRRTTAPATAPEASVLNRKAGQ